MSPSAAGPAPLTGVQVRLLLASAALSSAVGLVLQLLLVTQASYLAGDAALATGVVVGTFLAAMGLGAWLSQFVAVPGAGGPAGSEAAGHEAAGGEVGVDEPAARDRRSLLRAFVLVELCLSPLALLGPLALFALFAVDGPLWLALVLLTLAVGALGGMELPLLTRLLEGQQQLRRALARVLALDYLGALLGSLAFPLVLLPWLGLLPTAALLALVPLLCSAALCWGFPALGRWRWPVLAALPVVGAAALLVAPLGDRVEDALYDDPVIGRLQTRHQRIVLTRRRQDLRLYLDGNLQFSSLDEYRYHEALVHPAMALHGHARRVLLLGAGDGLALREILRWPGVQRVDLVELDPAMLRLARRQPLLRRLNRASLDDPRVHVHLGDAFALVPTLPAGFDVIIADFPDPATPPLARLYSVGFYGRLLGRLAPDGLVVTQASTPFFTPKVMASIEATFAALRLKTRPYSITVPSFGPWGFVLAHRGGRRLANPELPFPTRWLDRAQMVQMFSLPRDLRPAAGERVQPNRLVRPVLADYQRQRLWPGDR